MMTLRKKQLRRRRASARMKSTSKIPTPTMKRLARKGERSEESSPRERMVTSVLRSLILNKGNPVK